jgi:hypothetical protein
MSPTPEDRREGALSVLMVFNQQDGAHEKKGGATMLPLPFHSAFPPPTVGYAPRKEESFAGTADA